MLNRGYRAPWHEGASPAAGQKKTFSISAVETGVALSLINQTDAAGAVQQALAGNVKGSFNTLSSNVQANKSAIIGTLGAGFVAKTLAKGFGQSTLAKLGPVRVRL